MATCFHCGLPAYAEYNRSISGELREFCCVGCQAITESIYSGGLQAFYEHRDSLNPQAKERVQKFEAFDLPDIQKSFVFPSENSLQTVQLVVSGISCAACAWLIENHLATLACVRSARVNVANHSLNFFWDDSQGKLSDVFASLQKIGYRVQPANDSTVDLQRKKDQKNALLRLGVAGLGMMQVGMVAVALHAGAIQGIEDQWRYFLRWVSLFFATPVILYSALPFFKSACLSLMKKRLNMDVPVSVALLLAYFSSVYSTVFKTGDVYFDSVSMFTFFLLLGRYLEMRARHSGAFETERLTQLVPSSVQRLSQNTDNEEKSLVPLQSVSLDDLIWVDAGDLIPIDGIVEKGQSTVDESLLTGESLPLAKTLGDTVFAGTLNSDTALTVRVKAVGQGTRIAEIEELVRRAKFEKPKQQEFADRIAGKFVFAVLIVSACVFTGWSFWDPSQAFWVTLSVLVVTCPCALSLATPVALTAGVTRLRQAGFLVSANHVLESLDQVDHIVFDKTGTLTEGHLRVQKVLPLAEFSEEFVRYIVVALERHSRHPIALAFAGDNTTLVATGVVVNSGLGIQGSVRARDETDGQMFTCRFGKPDFSLLSEPIALESDSATVGVWQLLTVDGVAAAWFCFSDKPRESIAQHLAALKSAGLTLSLLSGDRQCNVDTFIAQNDLTGIFEQACGDLLPEHKLQRIQNFQEQGDCVWMIGDGINDVPVISQSNVSTAVGQATQLAKTNADSVMLRKNLGALLFSLNVAKKVKVTIRQNLVWALGYNLCALPAAALGFVPPYLAALGMSLSSLIVVFNALRLSKTDT